MANGTPIYVGTRVVGEVRAGVFHKAVRANVHQLRQPPAWALDVQSLADAVKAGATVVAIYDTETRRTFTASVTRILTDGFRVSRGFGEQVALPIAQWSVTGGGVVAVQMPLFAEAA